MTVYKYVCQTCGAKYDFISRLAETNHDIRCPKCGAEKLKQRITSVSQESEDSESCDAYTTRESS
jgi:putative FmdB family regulatory protein